jgi:hypothetical protein
MPINPPDSWQQVGVGIIEVNNLYVLTDQGKLFIGGEYLLPQDYYNGGDAADLLWIDNKGATFMLYYPIRDHETHEYISSSQCKWFKSKGVYR